VNLESFMIVAAIIFAIGLYGALVKRNAITVLMSIELMFNGVNITAVALSRYVLPARLALEPDLATNEVAQFLLTGQVFAIFIITVAAAEVALGLAIILAIYRNRGSVLVSDINLMKK
jgi:NADH-quinone oxidoreductase subunit K